MSVDKRIPVHHPVAVIGAGQAGLSISWFLTHGGIDHVVFEKQRPGHVWRSERWDSFCLVTPNWQCQLPGFPYQGPDPHGFMLRDEIIDYIGAFVASFNPPVREGIAVRSLRANAQHGFLLEATDGLHSADQVVIAAEATRSRSSRDAPRRCPATSCKSRLKPTAILNRCPR